MINIIFMIKRFFKLKTIGLIAAMCFPLIAFAVTQKEMEQARTIAAKSYLRYANDGSGYLDDLNPTTMDELEASLKTKEKENIKAFKAIPVPSDYQNWDKDKLVEYWAVTAFQNKGLLEKGRGGRIRARSLINKMTIAPPQKENSVAQAAKADNVAVQNTSSVPTADTANNPVSQLDSLKAREKALLSEEEILDDEDINVDKAYNYTWVYIMILVILVGVVVALVVYAANVMKRNGSSVMGIGKDNRNVQQNNEALEHLESTIADKDVEISMLKKKLEAAEQKNADFKKKLDSLTEEITILKSARSSVPTENHKKEEPSAENVSAKSNLRTIYLGRANNKGIFVRADRTLNVGHSVFILDTTDGFSGSFRVADSPAAWSLALSNPEEYLATACNGHNLMDTSDAERIVTETAGTAVFEGGCWRVIRKARIRYLS